MDDEETTASCNVLDVVVIGGGCSGLKAAETLFKNGWDNIVVLEALDRLGGRIETVLFNNDETLPLEMGAHWIHGTINNPVKKVTEENPAEFQHFSTKFFNRTQARQIRPKFYMDLHGNRYPTEVCGEIENTFYRWYSEALSFWYNKEKRELKHKNLQEFFDEKFFEYIESDAEELQRLKHAIYKTFLNYSCIYIGCNSLSECSLNEFGSCVPFPGPDEEFPGGYTRLIQHIAAKLPQYAIKLSHPVDTITYEHENLKVTCKNNVVFHTRHVIVTSSLNYLKENYQRLFNSEQELFGSLKVESFSRLSMGVVDRFYLVFDETIQFMPTEIDSLGPVFNDASFDDNEAEASGVQKWCFKLFRLFKFHDMILRFNVYGEQAIHVETLSDEEIIEQATVLLRKMFQGQYVPKPKQLIRSKWHSNPYIRGSYSFIPTNGSAENIKDLAEPIFIDGALKIMFAGEATSKNCYSTVHGAYMSGEREARRLIEYYKSYDEME